MSYAIFQPDGTFIGYTFDKSLVKRLQNERPFVNVLKMPNMEYESMDKYELIEYSEIERLVFVHERETLDIMMTERVNVIQGIIFGIIELIPFIKFTREEKSIVLSWLYSEMNKIEDLTGDERGVDFSEYFNVIEMMDILTRKKQ